MSESNELQPMYAVGDRVRMANPFDLLAEGDTTVYEIEDVQFNERYVTFFYRVNDRWVNEAWLEPDLFGPQFLNEEVSDMKKKQPTNRELLELDQDYELATLHDAMQTQNEPEIERSKKRLSEIHAELEAL